MFYYFRELDFLGEIQGMPIKRYAGKARFKSKELYPLRGASFVTTKLMSNLVLLDEEWGVSRSLFKRLECRNKLRGISFGQNL
jgi:hypothetical protein